jgi:hypothetical protein
MIPIHCIYCGRKTYVQIFHVAMYPDEDNSGIRCLGGNQGDHGAVCIKHFPWKAVLNFHWPKNYQEDTSAYVGKNIFTANLAESLPRPSHYGRTAMWPRKSKEERERRETKEERERRETKEEKEKKEERERCARSMVLKTIMAGLFIGCLGIILYAYPAKTRPEFLSIIGVAFLIAIAAFFSGGLLGFIFGVPRTQSQPPPSSLQPQTRASTLNPPATSQATPAQAAPSPAPPRQLRYQDNTNLEQISDWLCKILVGAGLTQLTALPGVLKRYALFFAPGLGGNTNTFHGEVFAVGLLIFFTVCGFLVGYLWTRLHLGKALTDDIEDQLNQVTSKITSLEEQPEIDKKALSLVERLLNPIKGTPIPTQEELNAAMKPASTPARSRIFFKAQKLREENWQVDKAKMARTIPIFRALIAADVENVYPANHAELGFALKDQDDQHRSEAEEELSKAIEIRDNLGKKGYLIYEFNRALCRIYQDPGFKAGPSDDKTKQAILADLKAAAQEPSVKALIEKEPAITIWLGNNTLDLKAIFP